MLHQTYGPWFFYGERHREYDQPAIIHADSSQEWWKFNRLYNRSKDQPNVIWGNGRKQWVIAGTNVSM